MTDKDTLAEIALFPVEMLELSNRAMNCLAQGGVKTVGDIMWLKDHELLRIPNLGRGSLREIQERTKDFIEEQLASASMVPADIRNRARAIAKDFAREQGFSVAADVVTVHRLTMAIAEALAQERGRSGRDEV